jgi:hypothetical protein
LGRRPGSGGAGSGRSSLQAGEADSASKRGAHGTYPRKAQCAGWTALRVAHGYLGLLWSKRHLRGRVRRRTAPKDERSGSRRRHRWRPEGPTARDAPAAKSLRSPVPVWCRLSRSLRRTWSHSKALVCSIGLGASRALVVIDGIAKHKVAGSTPVTRSLTSLVGVGLFPHRHGRRSSICGSVYRRCTGVVTAPSGVARLSVWQLRAAPKYSRPARASQRGSAPSTRSSSGRTRTVCGAQNRRPGSDPPDSDAPRVVDRAGGARSGPRATLGRRRRGVTGRARSGEPVARPTVSAPPCIRTLGPGLGIANPTRADRASARAGDFGRGEGRSG